MLVNTKCAKFSTEKNSKNYIDLYEFLTYNKWKKKNSSVLKPHDMHSLKLYKIKTENPAIQAIRIINVSFELNTECNFHCK